MADRRRRAGRTATRASGVTALLLPLLAAAPSASPTSPVVTAPASTSAPVGASTLVPGASISGLEASEVVRVLVGVSSGTLSVPASAAGVTAAAGYPALGTEGPALALEGRQDALNAALAQLRWTPAAAGSVAVTIDASPAGAAYDPANGHFYQVVTPEQDVDWNAAEAAAGAATFAGQTGYLATITDAGEEAVVAQVTPDPAWIGGNRQQDGHDWSWATGPEAGTTFWRPDCGLGTQGECQSSAGPMFAMWAPGEPGSLANATATTFLGRTGDGRWTPSVPSTTHSRFVVEFGGSPGDEPAAVSHADATLTAARPITAVAPEAGAKPARSAPPTVAPTPTTEAPPDTTAPPVTEPATTTARTTTAPAPVPAPAPTKVTPTTTATTATPVVVTAAPADPATTGPTSPQTPSGLPVYIVFDVGVGTPVADVKATVRGMGLQAGSVLTVEVHSASAILARAAVDGTGTITTDVGLPADLSDGEHTLVATATAVDGSPLQREAPFALAGGVLTRIGAPGLSPSASTTSPPTTAGATTVASSDVAATDTSSGSGGLPKPLIIGLLVALAGSVVWLVRRRRSSGGGPGSPPLSAPADPARDRTAPRGVLTR